MIEHIERDARTILDPDTESHEPDHEPHGLDPRELARVGFVALAAVAVWFRLWEPFAAVSVIGVAATLIGGYPIFKEAVENITQRRMTMELSMTIALVAALAIGQAFTALVITAFVLAAEILEHLTVSRGRAAISDLLSYLPQIALVRRELQIEEVRVDSLRAGDVVLVNPGALVPVDGVVIAGHSFVDEARITGESLDLWIHARRYQKPRRARLGCPKSNIGCRSFTVLVTYAIVVTSGIITPALHLSAAYLRASRQVLIFRARAYGRRTRSKRNHRSTKTRIMQTDTAYRPRSSCVIADRKSNDYGNPRPLTASFADRSHRRATRG